MKNPFLEGRNIFSKVPKPISKLPKDDNPPENTTDQMPSYDSKYSLKPQIRPMNTLTSNPKPTSQIPNTYQRQTPAYTSNQTNKATSKYMSSQKITFGDPMSSQAYHGDRTSGYFNMLNSQQQNNAKPHQNKYDNLKYEPRKNNFIEHDYKQTSQQFFQPSDMKQTRKQFGKSYNQYNNNFNNSSNNGKPKLEYEFAPPPINSFATTQPFDAKYHYQDHNYDYNSPYGTNQQRPSYQTSEQQHFQNHNQRLPNDSNLLTKKNPFTSNSYKSPPKQYDPLVTPKGDISQRFKDHNYAQFSPIGEVSRHKINEDSIMNLDGLMDGLQLDKLLAESKTQEQLLKILGMDASMIKKNNDSGDNYSTANDYKHNQYQNRPAQMNVYTANYSASQPQTSFNKKPYQPQSSNQSNRFQTFKDEEEEPQVFNYGQSSVKNLAQSNRTINNQAQNHRQSPPKFVKLPTNPYQEPQRNAYHYSQIQEPKTNRNQKTAHNQQIQSEEYDMQKIMQRQMEKFTMSQDGFGRDKRVYMTANQKIFAKKYKLQSL